jgi:hypothetical protein
MACSAVCWTLMSIVRTMSVPSAASDAFVADPAIGVPSAPCSR